MTVMLGVTPRKVERNPYAFSSGLSQASIDASVNLLEPACHTSSSPLLTTLAELISFCFQAVVHRGCTSRLVPSWAKTDAPGSKSISSGNTPVQLQTDACLEDKTGEAVRQ
jgi:hypothetical protein